jgi:hypothetical protein
MQQHNNSNNSNRNTSAVLLLLRRVRRNCCPTVHASQVLPNLGTTKVPPRCRAVPGWADRKTQFATLWLHIRVGLIADRSPIVHTKKVFFFSFDFGQEFVMKDASL